MANFTKVNISINKNDISATFHKFGIFEKDSVDCDVILRIPYKGKVTVEFEEDFVLICNCLMTALYLIRDSENLSFDIDRAETVLMRGKTGEFNLPILQ